VKESLEDLYERVKNHKISKDDFISELRQIRAYSDIDRFKLAVVDDAPFTMWACGRDCLIKYWECKSSVVYGIDKKDAIDKNYLDLFVSDDERAQSELDAIKIIEGKAKPGEFVNNIAEDHNSSGSKVVLMTNCFRVVDPKSKEPLQAEIALPTDIDEVIEKYKLIIQNAEIFKKLKRRGIMSIDNLKDSVVEFTYLYKRKIQNAKRDPHVDNNALNQMSSRLDDIERDAQENIQKLSDRLNHCKMSADYHEWERDYRKVDREIIDQYDEFDNELKHSEPEYNGREFYDDVNDLHMTWEAYKDTMQRTVSEEIKSLEIELKDLEPTSEAATKISHRMEEVMNIQMEFEKFASGLWLKVSKLKPKDALSLDNYKNAFKDEYDNTFKKIESR